MVELPDISCIAPTSGNIVALSCLEALADGRTMTSTRGSTKQGTTLASMQIGGRPTTRVMEKDAIAETMAVPMAGALKRNYASTTIARTLALCGTLRQRMGMVILAVIGPLYG